MMNIDNQAMAIPLQKYMASFVEHMRGLKMKGTTALNQLAQPSPDFRLVVECHQHLKAYPGRSNDLRTEIISYAAANSMTAAQVLTQLLAYYPNVDFTVAEILTLDGQVTTLLSTMNSTTYSVQLGPDPFTNLVFTAMDNQAAVQSALQTVIDTINGSP